MTYMFIIILWTIVVLILNFLEFKIEEYIITLLKIGGAISTID